jgi:hypothetical protein
VTGKGGSHQSEGVDWLENDRVVRGGAWNHDPDNARAAYRNRNHPDNRNNNLGFRLAASHITRAGVLVPPPELMGGGSGCFLSEALDGGAGSVPRPGNLRPGE